jgi:endonuclease-8
VGFSLGIVELLDRAAEDDAVGHLGPDLLGPDWDPAEAERRLRADPARPVGEALLDQRNLAGIGNLYKSELCFLSGLHPRTPVGAVNDLERIVDRAHRMLFVNRARVEQPTTGDLRRGRQHWVYRRDRQPCRRCGTRILVDQQGPEGQERATYWCPTCQPSQ